MMIGDKYYGASVTNYDAARCHTLRWAREQLAVNDFVKRGPVLDVPIGTARYRAIYREKNLRVTGLDISDDMIAFARSQAPEIEIQKGDVRSIPFGDKAFKTVVCTRLLDWLAPDQMRDAVAELRRVSHSIVVTIRHGDPQCRVNFTHQLSTFYAAIDGLHIVDRRETERTSDGIEEIFLIRPPKWGDAAAQFKWHGPPAEIEMQRIADEWRASVGKKPIDAVCAENYRATATFWTGEKCADVLKSMARDVRDWITDEAPRFCEHGPATVLDYRGTPIVLDGRRRMNQWAKSNDGLFPVLVLSRR